MTEPHLPQPDPDNAATPPSVTSHVISKEDQQWSPDGPPAVTGRATRRAPLGSWRRLTALVGVVGLLGSGAFAVKQFAAPSSNTPTQAVQQFLSALGTGDAIGAIETLAPGERDLMVDTAVPLVEELKRLDIIDSKNDLRKLDSAGIKFIGQAFAEQVVREDITTVQMTGGSVTMSADPSKILGGVVKQFSDSLPANQSKSEPFKEGSLTTIKRDGRWYVSLQYSIAEAARRSSGKPMPTLAESIAAVGTSTPEAAVEQMLQRVGALDLRGAIALMDPDEMQVLQDYGPLFLPELEKERIDAKKFFTLTFPKLELQSKQVDGRTVVSITKLSADLLITADGFKGHMIVDGDCLDVTYQGKRSKQCGDDIKKIFTDLSDSPEAAAQAEKLWTQRNRRLFSDPASAGAVTVTQRDGKWFVSPLRTTFGSLLTSLRKVKPQDLKGAGKTPEERIQSLMENPLFGGLAGGVPGALFGGSGGPGVSESVSPDFPTELPTELPTDLPTTADSEFDSGVSFGESVTESGSVASTISSDLEALQAEIDAELNRLNESTSPTTAVPTTP